MKFRTPLTLIAMAAAAVAGYLYRDRPAALMGLFDSMAPSEPGTLPPDIFPDSRNRMPLITREELNELGQRLYDEALADPRSIVGLQGPGGIRLGSPRLTELSRPVNRFLRYGAGLDRRLAELAILASARETDQRFEWHAHEAIALKEGLEPAIIDVIRYRRPLSGMGEKEATLITLAREAIGKHEVRPETFADALRLFGKEDLILYVTLMGEYAATGFLLHTFNQQLPEGVTSTLPRV
jgi:4-carboxymuconolactone decarboxylase